MSVTCSLHVFPCVSLPSSETQISVSVPLRIVAICLVGSSQLGEGVFPCKNTFGIAETDLVNSVAYMPVPIRKKVKNQIYFFTISQNSCCLRFIHRVER